MNIYQEFATHLDQLRGGVHAVRITVAWLHAAVGRGDWIQ
jgi:hypothetical protein